MRLPLEVITRNMSDLDAPATRKVIDHADQSDRKWLGKHCWWAFRNNHSVHTAPVQR